MSTDEFRKESSGSAENFTPRPLISRHPHFQITSAVQSFPEHIAGHPSLKA